MRHCLVALFLLVFVAPLSWAQAPEARSCKKSFRVSGWGTDGKNHEFTMTIRHPLEDLPGFDPALEEVSDEKVYRGSGYQVQPVSATHKMNCAGYVLNNLFQTGVADVDVSVLRGEILKRFARVTTGNPRPGDVVVFGDDKHVAVVVEPSATNGSAVIESKDNQESVVRGKVSLTYAAAIGNYIGVVNDPIVRKHGTPVVYRVVNKPQVEPLTSGECDPPDLTGQWEDSAGSVYTLTRQMELDGTVRVTGTVAGSARAGHPNLTGTIDVRLVDKEWEGLFRNQEPDAAGRIVWSDGSIHFAVSPDEQSLDGRATGTLHWDGGTRPLTFPLHFERKR